MATLRRDGPLLHVETERYTAAIRTEGYVSGVMGGSFVDRASGSRDLGHGLVIADFLLQPGQDDPDTPEELRYHYGDPLHGGIPKRYVELPQICTQAGRLPFEVIEGRDFVAVRQWYVWSVARPPYRPGSTWQQWLLFPDGPRWFLAFDQVTSVNTVDGLILRQDIPGHLKHPRGDEFREIALSYDGVLPATEFREDFAPDERHFYRRDPAALPERMIRAYRLANGTWLAAMCLDPAAIYEGWCHQRGYVCMIQEIGGRPVAAGESFGAVHLVGYFDSLDEAERTYDTYSGAVGLRVDPGGWELICKSGRPQRKPS